MEKTVNERPVYVCVTRSFFGGRFYNPGDRVRSKKNPGLSFRLLSDTDRPSDSVASVPMDDFTSTL
jgi:hypothetical protein